MFIPITRWMVPLACLSLASCALTPKCTDQERDRMAQVGRPYIKAFHDRDLPKLPAQPTWRQVLHRALLANGELEAAYFQWQAAVDRIDIASTWPDTNLTLGGSYMFSDARMKTFDRMTFSAGFPMKPLSYPGKAKQAGRVALENAKAAGEQLRVVKFKVQRQVLTAWATYAFLAEKVRLERMDVGLLKSMRDAADAKARSGGRQQDLIQAQVALVMGEDTLKATEAQLQMTRTTLNGLLARKPDSVLVAPKKQPDLRELLADDAKILAVGVENNPGLAQMAKQVAGRKDALTLARMQWIPDITPSASITGSLSQMIGAGVMLPTTVPAIRASIRQAQALQRSSEAALRQAKYDTGGRFVGMLVMLRDSERQIALYESRILPLLRTATADALANYVAGKDMYAQVIAGERAQLMVRMAMAKFHAARETQLAELEALAGVDSEMFESQLKKEK